MVWVRLTLAKIKPDKVAEMLKEYYDEIVPAVKAQKGNVDIFMLEPVDKEDAFISYNAWESKADGDAYEASGNYQAMLNKVKGLLAETPTVKTYTVK